MLHKCSLTPFMTVFKFVHGHMEPCTKEQTYCSLQPSFTPRNRQPWKLHVPCRIYYWHKHLTTCFVCCLFSGQNPSAIAGTMLELRQTNLHLTWKWCMFQCGQQNWNYFYTAMSLAICSYCFCSSVINRNHSFLWNKEVWDEPWNLHGFVEFPRFCTFSTGQW